MTRNDINQNKSLEKRLDLVRSMIAQPGRLLGSAGHVVHVADNYKFKVLDLNGLADGTGIKVRDDAPADAINLAQSVYNSHSKGIPMDLRFGRYLQVQDSHFLAVPASGDYAIALKINLKSR